MITQKNIYQTLLSQTFPVKEIQKKRDCARGMRVFRARKTRAREPASPRRWRWWQYITPTFSNDKSKYDLKKPSEPEEKERGRERFFLYLCVLGKVLSGYRERERERERERNENFGDDVMTKSMNSRRVRCVWAMITPSSEPNIVSLSLSLSLSSLFPRWYRKREEKNKSRCVSEKKFCFVSYLVSFVRDKPFGRWCG